MSRFKISFFILFFLFLVYLVALTNKLEQEGIAHALDMHTRELMHEIKLSKRSHIDINDEKNLCNIKEITLETSQTKSPNQENLAVLLKSLSSEFPEHKNFITQMYQKIAEGLKTHKTFSLYAKVDENIITAYFIPKLDPTTKQVDVWFVSFQNDNDLIENILTNGNIIWVMFFMMGVLLLLIFNDIQSKNKLKGKSNQVEHEKKQLRAIMDALPIMLFMKDAKELRFVKLNRIGEELLGTKESDMIGKNDYDFFSKTQADFFTQKDREALSGHKETVTTEESIQTPYGNKILLTQKVAIRNSEGEALYLLGISQDITQKKQLEEQNKLLSQSLDMITDAAYICNKDGSLVYINQAAINAVGYSKEELLGMKIYDIDAQSAQMPWSQRWEVMQTVKRLNLESLHKCKDGTIFPVEIAISTVEYQDDSFAIGIARDITERKKAQKILLESEERFRSIFENSAAGIVVADIETKNISLTNETMCTMLGYTLEELTGMKMTQLHPPEDLGWVLRNFDEQAKENIKLTKNIPMLRKDGIHFYADITPSIMEINARKQLVGIFQDVTQRYENEQELNRYKTKLEQLVEERTATLKRAESLSHTGSWYVDFASGELVWSDEVYTIFEHPKDEAVTMELFISTIHPEDSAKTLQKWKRALLGDEYRVEHRITTRKGVKWVLEIAEVTFDEERKPLHAYGAVQDITQLIASKHQLTQAKNQYETLIENMGEKFVFFRFDMQGIIRYASKSFQTVFRIDLENVIGNDWKMVVDWTQESLVEGEKSINQHIDGQDFQQQVMHFKTADGIVHSVQVSSFIHRDTWELQYIDGIFEDITHKLAIEEELRRSSKEFEKLFENASVALVYVDSQGKLIKRNAKFFEYFGYQNEEIADTQSWFLKAYPNEIYRQQAIQTWTQSTNDAILNDNKIPPYEYTITTKDGTLKQIIISGILFDEGMMATFVDVTQQRQIEKDLIISKELAESAMRAESQFLANMSHEIRTPMNAIIGMSGLALEEEISQKASKYITNVYGAAKGLLGIINDILDFSKIEAGKMELSCVHFQLNTIIATTLSLLKEQSAQKKIRIRVKLDTNLPLYYYADSLRLGQVLLNLLSNAVKFSPEASAVTLEVSLIEEHPNEVMIKFAIHDEGIGISLENQKRLFQPFSQADNSTTRQFGGTGLGLIISKNIVELMGGTISVESQEGEGSIFAFEIMMQKSDQLSVEETVPKLEKSIKAVTKNLYGCRVLLVEDNELNRELATDILAKYGLSVAIAVNGLEALEKLKEQDFHCILMDLQMPVMDGYEATRRIRVQERYKELPILAMTANILESDRIKAFEAGMNDYIAKPIEPTAMFATLSQWVCKEA